MEVYNITMLCKIFLFIFTVDLILRNIDNSVEREKFNINLLHKKNYRPLFNYKYLNENRDVSVLVFDLRKAFDIVDLTIPLNKIRNIIMPE